MASELLFDFGIQPSEPEELRAESGSAVLHCIKSVSMQLPVQMPHPGMKCPAQQGDDVSCGYHKDKLAKIVDGGAYMPSTRWVSSDSEEPLPSHSKLYVSRAGALSTCGPVCAAEPSCDGFIWTAALSYAHL